MTDFDAMETRVNDLWAAYLTASCTPEERAEIAAEYIAAKEEQEAAIYAFLLELAD